MTAGTTQAVERQFTLARLRQAAARQHHQVDAGAAYWSFHIPEVKVTVRYGWRTWLKWGAWLVRRALLADRLWDLLGEHLGLLLRQRQPVVR